MRHLSAAEHEQDGFYIERLDKYMGHGFGIADNLFAAHFGDSFLYGTDMLGPHPGESLEPTPEGTRVVQVSPNYSCSRFRRAVVFLFWSSPKKGSVRQAISFGFHRGREQRQWFLPPPLPPCANQ